jgi:ketosteroid isomerase-like protein
VAASSIGIMSATPDVISRYYAAATDGDLDTVIGCFTVDAHVLDEGSDHNGVDEIRRWREDVATKYTYTTLITGVETSGDGAYVVATHLEGDFPGGVVDLEQRFTLTDGLISELLI